MRRSDVGLFLVVGALGVFVAAQVVERRPAARPAAVPVRVAAAPQASPDTGPPPKHDLVATSVHSTRLAPERNLDQIRELIASTPGTYMADMLADLDGRLVRWPDRRQEGLRIWVQSATPVRDWDPRYAQMARDAFDDWSRDAELPLRFDFVLDSVSADIRVEWTERFAASFGQRVGTTRRTADQHGWLVSAEIVVAIHDSTGQTIPPDALGGVVRHEAGHALGMGHSNDPRTKMFPTEMISAITSADRSTLSLLYQLPPGLVK